MGLNSGFKGLMQVHNTQVSWMNIGSSVTNVFFFFFLRRYDFREVLAFSTNSFHLGRFLMQSFQSVIFIFVISLFTSSSHLFLGLPSDLVNAGAHSYSFFTMLLSVPFRLSNKKFVCISPLPHACCNPLYHNVWLPSRPCWHNQARYDTGSCCAVSKPLRHRLAPRRYIIDYTVNMFHGKFSHGQFGFL